MLEIQTLFYLIFILKDNIFSAFLCKEINPIVMNSHLFMYTFFPSYQRITKYAIPFEGCMFYMPFKA